MAEVRFIDAHELERLMATGTAYLVDVREANEHAQARIAGAKLVALSTFDAAEITPGDGAALIFHCRSGVRCGKAAEHLLASGYTGEILRLEGGIIAWAEAGMPVETGDG